MREVGEAQGRGRTDDETVTVRRERARHGLDDDLVLAPVLAGVGERRDRVRVGRARGARERAGAYLGSEPLDQQLRRGAHDVGSGEEVTVGLAAASRWRIRAGSRGRSTSTSTERARTTFVSSPVAIRAERGVDRGGPFRAGRRRRCEQGPVAAGSAVAVRPEGPGRAGAVADLGVPPAAVGVPSVDPAWHDEVRRSRVPERQGTHRDGAGAGPGDVAVARDRGEQVARGARGHGGRDARGDEPVPVPDPDEGVGGGARQERIERRAGCGRGVGGDGAAGAQRRGQRGARHDVARSAVTSWTAPAIIVMRSTHVNPAAATARTRAPPSGRYAVEAGR